MDERFLEMIGPEIVEIAEEFETLSAADLIELKKKKVKKVWCVYANWQELAEVNLADDRRHDCIPAYLTECIDMKKYLKWLKKNCIGDFSDGGYEELSSGKVIQAEY